MLCWQLGPGGSCWLLGVSRRGLRKRQETYSCTSTQDAGVSLWWLAAPPLRLRVSKNSPKDFLWKSRKGRKGLQCRAAAVHRGYLNTPVFYMTTLLEFKPAHVGIREKWLWHRNKNCVSGFKYILVWAYKGFISLVSSAPLTWPAEKVACIFSTDMDCSPWRGLWKMHCFKNAPQSQLTMAEVVKMRKTAHTAPVFSSQNTAVSRDLVWLSSWVKTSHNWNIKMTEIQLIINDNNHKKILQNKVVWNDYHQGCWGPYIRSVKVKTAVLRLKQKCYSNAECSAETASWHWAQYFYREAKWKL